MGPAGEAGNRSKRNAGTAQVRGVESVLLRMKSVAEGMGEDAREDLPKDRAFCFPSFFSHSLSFSFLTKMWWKLMNR